LKKLRNKILRTKKRAWKLKERDEEEIENESRKRIKNLQRSFKKEYRKAEREYDQDLKMMTRLGKQEWSRIKAKKMGMRKIATPMGEEAIQFAKKLENHNQTEEDPLQEWVNRTKGEMRWIGKIPIEEKETERAMRRLKRNVSAGYDGLKAEFILWGQEALVKPITILMNRLWEEGLPKSLREANVLPIPKIAAPQELDDYRPITMASALVKVYAYILIDRILVDLHFSKGISDSQFGFRHCRETSNAIFILTELLDNAEKEKKPIYCISWT
jgi:hypothetical protein